MLAIVTSNGASDFDFLHGSWTFHLRKLRDTTDPDCTEWVESEGTSEAFSRDGGATWATNWITSQRRRTEHAS
jgi:hypothetical protein